METYQVTIKNDLYIKNNLSSKLNIFEYIKVLNLNHLYNHVFDNLWFALNHKNLIIINKELLNFIFKENKNKIYCLYKIIKKKHNYIFYTQNNENFKEYLHLNTLFDDCCYLISFVDLKHFLFSRKKIDFPKINYIISIEKLFKDYNMYLNTGILFKNEDLFIKKQNIIKTDLKVFEIFWDSIKNNHDIIITHHILKFLDFDVPCIQHTFKKNYNEKILIEFLNKAKIPFEKIKYKDERCFNNKEVYNFLSKYYKNKKLKNKKWILLTLENFKSLLCFLRTERKQEIISYFIKVNLLYNSFFTKKINKSNISVQQEQGSLI